MAGFADEHVTFEVDAKIPAELADGTKGHFKPSSFADGIGLGPSDSPQFTGIELGHATDTTLTRTASGRLAVEGVGIPLATDLVESALSVSGMDHTGATSCNTALATLISTGGAWYFPDGDYMITGAGVTATRAEHLYILCSPKARFFSPTGASAVEGDFFNFAVPSGGAGLPTTGLVTIWQGGYFDLQNVKNSTSLPHSGTYPAANLGAAATGDALSFRDTFTSGTVQNGSDRIEVRGATFYHGDHWESAGGDQSIFAEGYRNFTVEGCTFVGARDLGVYASGDSTGVLTGRSRIVNNTFTNCFFGAAVKRGMRGFEISGNTFKGCVGGALVNELIGDEPADGVIAGNDFDECGAWIRVDYAKRITVRDNSGRRFGAADEGGAAVTVLAAEVIALNGATYCTVENNRCEGVSTAFAAINTFMLGVNDYTTASAAVVLSQYNLFRRNVSVNLYSMGGEATGEANNNHFDECYNVGGTIANPVVVGAGTSVVRWDVTNSRRIYTTPVGLGDGTAAAPAMARATQTSTGVFYALNKIGFATAGTERVAVTSAGLEFGATTDTTLARSAAGRLAVEGVGIPLATDYWVSAKLYGATGDGVTDDTAAITSALAAASAVFLPAGTYIVTNLTIPSNKTLVGTKESILKNAANAADITGCVRLANATTNVNLLGFAIDGNDANQSNTFVYGVMAGTSCSNINVIGLKVTDIKRSGIYFQGGCTNVEVSDNHIDTTGRFGIVWDYSTLINRKIRARNNYIANCAESAISVISDNGTTPSAGSIDIEFTGNVTENNLGGIAGYSPNNDNFRVMNNTVRSSGNHGSHLGGTNLVIKNNTIITTTNASIVISNFPNDGPVQGAGFEVSGNTCRSTSTVDNGVGILVQNFDNGVIANNNIRTMLESGIYIDGLRLAAGSRCVDITVSGNTINDVDDGSTHTTAESGIHVRNADRITIAGNTARNTYDAVCQLDSVRYSTVVGNTFSGSVNSSGILVVDNGGVTASTYNTIVGNTSQGNSTYGIQSTGTSDYLTVRSNTLTGNGTAALSLAGANDVTDEQIVTLADTQTLIGKTLTAPKGVFYTIAQSSVQVSRASVNGAGDATEATLVTVTIPAGSMGPNGSVRWRALWSGTSSGNAKTMRVRFGGTGGTLYQNSSITTSQGLTEYRQIQNRNSESSQVGTASGLNGGVGATSGSLVTSAINTTAAVDLVFRCNWAGAVSAETIALESYCVEVCYGA